MMATLFDMHPPVDGGLKLNDAQRRAITHGEGPLLVIAGAGTGKTRVITERIRHLLDSDFKLEGKNILGLTFTKKAAGEMKARVVKACDERGKDVVLATFHSFCEALLKEVEPKRLALEEVDHWILLRRNMARLKLERYRKLAEPGHFLSDFVKFFSRCQDELVSSERYAEYAEELARQLEIEKDSLDEDSYKERLETVGREHEVARAYRASDELLREKKAVALGGLIPEAVALLEKDAALRARLQERYKYILVDEFQDTNIGQLRLLELLSGPSRNIVAVGDNDQAIYRFRGASFGSFKLFLERFAGWKAGEDSGAFRVSLTQNYRSTPNILRVATQAISMNEVSADFPNKLLDPAKPEGERIRIAELSSVGEEAAWVADELERLHGAGRRWRDFAVLYRKHALRGELVKELRARKMPFVISRLSILQHPLVRDLIAYLRVIATPYDDIACARVLAAPAWHMEPADLVRLAERAKKEKKPIHDMLQRPQGELAFNGSHAALPVLLEFVSAQRKTLKRRSAGEILSDVTEWLELHQRAETQDKKYVKRLAEFVKEWEPKSETRGLIEFLEYLDYFEQAGGHLCLEDDSPGDAVQLMTVHGAKGLEFGHVFLLHVNSRAFPSGERRPLFEFPVALMKEDLPTGDFHIQEERRLFYVALTRAEERLTITTVTEKKGKVPLFIEDLLMDPSVKKRDVLQIAPKAKPLQAKPENESAKPEAADLFTPADGPARIFSRIANWAKDFHPPSGEPLKLSPSAIENYRRCPQQYLFGRLWSLREGPQAALSFGSVMHTTIKRFMEQIKRGVKLPFEDVRRIFETEWTSAGFEDAYQEGEYKKDGLEQMKAFHSAVLSTGMEIREQEKSFELPLENNVIITGRMDQINSLGRDDVEIVDYKTGKPRTDVNARKDLQLSIYAIAAKEILELNPVRLVFHYLQNNQMQVTTRDAKQLEEAQKIVQEAAADIRAGEFTAVPGFVCRGCAYKGICPGHEEGLSGE